MAKEIFIRADRTGKVFLQLAGACSDFSEFECLVSKFGEFPYIVKLKREMPELQRIRNAKLQEILQEVETAARSHFGEQYTLREFVLIGR